MLLEAQLYPEDCVTMLLLTYRPEDLPRDVSQAKKQYQNFMKRVRKDFNLPGHKYVQGKSLRYVAGLEKGTQYTKRFHWHVIMYGLRYTFANRHFLEKMWPHGFVYWKIPAGKDYGRAMAYVCKYAIKDGVFLCSRKPGIGDGMIPAINEMLNTLSPQELAKLGDARIRSNVQAKYFLLKDVNNQEVAVKKAQWVRMGKTLQSLRVGGYYFPLHDFIKKRLKKLENNNGKK